MIRRILFLYAILCPFLSINASALSEALDSVFDARYKADEPGAAIIIAKGDSIIYERYAGTADMKTGEKVGADTRFCIASVSKQFTVMGLLKAAQAYDGPLGILDTPVSRWFDFGQTFWDGISLRNLASHTSGVPDARPRDDRNRCVFADEEESISYFPQVTSDMLKFGAGEYYDYLNPSFILLAKVTERLSGMTWEEYMCDSVFMPAEMTQTYLFDPEREGESQSHAYAPADSGWEEYDYGEETFYATRPDGAIYTTARDLLKWENALRDEKIVDKATLADAYRPVVNVSASPFCDYQQRPDTWYGLGFFIEHHPGKARKIFHTGDNGGYQAYLAKYPEKDIKIIVLENRHDHDRQQLAELIDRLLSE